MPTLNIELELELDDLMDQLVAMASPDILTTALIEAFDDDADADAIFETARRHLAQREAITDADDDDEPEED